MARRPLDVFRCSRFILFTFSHLRVVAHVRIHLTRKSSAAVRKTEKRAMPKSECVRTARGRLQRLVRSFTHVYLLCSARIASASFPPKLCGPRARGILRC